MNFLKTHISKIVAGLAGLLLVGGVVLAQTTVYQGYNPAPPASAGGGYNGLPGVVLAQTGTVAVPVLSTGNTACAVVSQVNGTVFKATTSATTATCVLVFPYAAPNGYLCQFIDITTPAAAFKQAATTTTSCTSASTATAGAADTVYIIVEAF